MRGVDLEKLKQLGETYLKLVKRQLETTGEVTPVMLLMGSPLGIDEVVEVDPRLLMSEDRKDGMAEMLKQRVVSEGFTAVASLFDAHSLKVRSKAEADMVRKLKGLGMNIPQIHEMGLGEYVEMAFFMVETIDNDGFELKIEYRRTESGIEFSPVECKDGCPIIDGRMKFFNNKEA